MGSIGEVTTLTLAKSKSPSLRTTVPMSIVLQFDLKQGDKLGWKMEVRDGNLAVLVRPIRAETIRPVKPKAKA